MRRLVALFALTAPVAAAQEVVTSPAPDSVAVTVYRAPDRSTDTAMDLDWLQGYALVTEKRTVAIPQGRATIRFEGVAAGLFPESALVTGLPAGVREKNMDADLLSSGALYARAFGRPVTLRRLHPGSGKEREERAIIRSGPDGAAILQTKDGFEVADCGGLSDTIVYPDVPKDLSARPTLSVETQSPAPARVTLSLSYLAWGFDWQANYVVRMHPDGRRADLDAWVTLASSDSTSFADAQAGLVAGKVNREDSAGDQDKPSGSSLVLRCYLAPQAPPPPMVAPPPPAPVMMMAPMAEAADIVVTSRKAVAVVQEALGDLKFYRVPMPTTVAANAQKQVMLAQKRDVAVTPFYRADVTDADVYGPVSLMLRTRNRKEDGLGLPLPGGPVTVFEPHGQASLLAGEGGLPDKAVGEDVELTVGTATQVTVEASATDASDRLRHVTVTVSNARAQPVQLETRIATQDDAQLVSPSARLLRKAGRWVWAVTLPANGRATLRYTLRRPD